MGGMELLFSRLGFDVSAVRENVGQFQQTMQNIDRGLTAMLAGQEAIRQELAIQRGILLKLAEKLNNGTFPAGTRSNTAGACSSDGELGGAG
jgi:hypothetical protein